MKSKLFKFFLISSLSLVLGLIVELSLIYFYKNNITKTYAIQNNDIINDKTTTKIITTKEILPDINKKSITISAVVDCTIGWDNRFAYTGRFDETYNKYNDYGYYFKNVKDLFEKDDLTIANLEGTFTNYTEKKEKKFNFSAPPEYVNVLLEGNVDIVSIANNHSYDYKEQGYKDTLNTLSDANISYYGFTNYLIKEINGIKIGFFGVLDIYGERYSEVDRAIKYLKNNNCDLIIASMHWGIEYDYKQSNEQVKMGHFLIDNGVDLVIGHHPHVVQGIEKYKDKYIVYSLGNFSFGGNQNPKDKDTFIWQQEFVFINNKLSLDSNINIIPASLSGVSNYNNYQPVILNSTEKDRVLEKIMKYSSGFIN